MYISDVVYAANKRCYFSFHFLCRICLEIHRIVTLVYHCLISLFLLSSVVFVEVAQYYNRIFNIQD